MSDPDIEDAVKRLAGFAALRRLRRLVDADQAQQDAQARWAARLAWAFALAAVLALAWLAFR
ncbi:MAG: hypothetical protein PHY45_03690 [Rhodocyclaceae bacterium]|nr:hypothetical protein [Rhodocyclaceae bacterium]